MALDSETGTAMMDSAHDGHADRDRSVTAKARGSYMLASKHCSVAPGDDRRRETGYGPMLLSCSVSAFGQNRALAESASRRPVLVIGNVERPAGRCRAYGSTEDGRSLGLSLFPFLASLNVVRLDRVELGQLAGHHFEGKRHLVEVLGM